MPVDYSRFDSIDDEDETPDPQANYSQKLHNHAASMQLIADWLKRAWPPLSDEQVAHILAFVAAQHRGIHPDNTKRATEIVAFIEARQAPSTKPLHALALLARQTYVKADEQKAQAQRVRHPWPG